MNQRSGELTILKRRLQGEIIRRKAAEESLRSDRRHHRKMLAEARHVQEQKRNLSHQILLAHEEERKLISRELHDEMSQTLAGINLKLSSLSHQASVSTLGLKKIIDDAHQLVEKSVSIVHRFARDLRPSMLDDLGLIPTLQAYIKDSIQRSGIQIRFAACSEVEKLGNDKRTALYRVAQSAISNVIHHAEATLVKVGIHRVSKGICLEIKDDGRSFDVDRILSAKRYKRLGLLSMRERTEMSGGVFMIVSLPGKGTTIRACVPFDKGKV